MRVAILADDLIWSTRLAGMVQGAGREVRAVRTAAGLEAALPEVDRVIVDLTARAYDGIAAIELARRAGLPILAVGQHDDADLRRRALAAGADRVHPYRRLHEDGDRVIAAWLAATPAPTGSPGTPAPSEPPTPSETTA